MSNRLIDFSTFVLSGVFGIVAFGLFTADFVGGDSVILRIIFLFCYAVLTSSFVGFLNPKRWFLSVLVGCGALFLAASSIALQFLRFQYSITMATLVPITFCCILLFCSYGASRYRQGI